MEIISSSKNARIKELQKLNKDAAFRREKGTFIVEGIRMIREIPFDKLLGLYVSESAYDRYKAELDTIGINSEDTRLFLLKDHVFEAISQTKSPQGLLAEVMMMEYSLDQLLEDGQTPFYLIIESLQDPGNMGTIFRTAEAAGVTALIIGGMSCDCYNPKVVRSTMGAIFRIPFIYTDCLKETIATIKKQGVTIFGAHLDGEDLYGTDLTGPAAFLIGNEGNGLSDEIAGTADQLIRIPMKGQVESLNAAVSSAILSYEVLRQRERQN